MNFSDRMQRNFEQASTWLAGNSFDILAAVGVGVAIALLLLALRGFGRRLVREREQENGGRSLIGRVLARTTLFFIIMVAAELVAELAVTPPPVLRAINVLFVVAAALQGAIWARELVLALIQHKVGEEEEQSRLGSAIGIIRLLVTVALFTIALIVILDNLGVNVTGLVAGLGIGGIAIGLAAQGIFKDLFAALSIIFDRPFRKGDGIRFDQITGTVEQIGLKTTRVRSLEGEEVVISNANLLEKQIHNFSNLEQRRMVLRFGVTYQTPTDLLAGISEMVRAIVEAHAQTRMIRCGLTGFGASSLDFELQFEVRTPDFEQVFATRSAICLEILRAFNEAGVQFAYPTQTSFTAAPDGTLVLPYPDVRMVATSDLGA